VVDPAASADAPARVTLVDRADWLLSMMTAFLDAPMPERH
jgi:hypothetical protein